MDDLNKPTKADAGYAAIKAALGSIPVLGAAATELFGFIVTPPLEKRRIALMNSLAERLKELGSRNELDFTQLALNDQFIDTVAQAMSYAIKTSESEKIAAFQNAILNTAIDEAPEKSKSQVFLNLIDRFTVWHIKIISFFNSPKKWFADNGVNMPNLYMGSLLSGLHAAFPALKGNDELVDVIWSDLANAGFHRSGDLKTMMSGDGIMAERTTELGKEFLEFISEPSK